MESCIFCRIVKKEIPANLLYEGEEAIAFPDVSPMAPVHLLIIPKRHFSHLGEMADKDLGIIQEMYKAAQLLAKQKGVSETGYRLAMNVNREGGQSVFHVHLHLLAGRQMGPSLVG